MKVGENNDIADELRETEAGRFEDNVLVISAVRNKVVFPYSVKELQKTLRADPEYKDMRDLIDKKYTVPLSRYKRGYISRYKEAFALVRERGNGSVLSAFGLAAEMFFTRLLHPAIIAACKNTDWLYVYLDCLDKNELDDFPFFQIRYEPNVPKNKRKTVV